LSPISHPPEQFDPTAASLNREARERRRELEVAHHELGHAFVAARLGLSVYYVTVRTPPGPRCLLDPDPRDIMLASRVLNADERVALETDLLVSVAGPIATGLFRGEDRDRLRRVPGMSARGGSGDWLRFCRAFQRLYGGVPELCYEDGVARANDEGFIQALAEKQRDSQAAVLEMIDETNWRRLTQAAAVLLANGSLCGDDLMTWLPNGG